MSLTPGTRLGPYEVSAQIGEGGMGEVYRATDRNLKRAVAIKVLPESVATDPERLARFQREAEVLGSLNHPNIAATYGLERSGGTIALVMELVEGEDLSQRIARGAIPIDETLAIARQIAEALEAAHEQGIVHRDLKPANITVRDDGTVKVLDFGLAKLVAAPQTGSQTATLSPTITTPAMTQVGVILGTAAYMSPEQAKGRAADRRSDIWAFGVVLFEMLAGRRAFEGEDVSDTLANVLKLDPDWTRLPTDVPARVRQVMRACLQKTPRQRIGDIQDVRLALDGAFETAGPAVASLAAPSSARRRGLSIGVAVVLSVLATALIGWSLLPTQEAQAVNRFDYDLPEGQALRNISSPVIALSPDGRSIVYNARGGLYLRAMGDLDARIIPGTEEPLLAPFFSPDGQSVAYFTTGGLKRIAISGGAPVLISAAATSGTASWGKDGSILFDSAEGIQRVSATGGRPALVIKARDTEYMYAPQLLPDGDSVLFSVATTGTWDQAQIVAQSISSGTRTVLVEGGRDARYLATGHLVYALEQGLFAVAFDVAALKVSGGPVPILQGLSRMGVRPANYAVADDGTMVYVSGGSGAPLNTLVWVDRQGREEPIKVPPRAYVYAQLSPDDTRVALDIRDQQNDIWIWDLARETLTRLTRDPGLNRGPVWTPDGKRVAFSQVVGGVEEIFWQAWDGSGATEPLTAGSKQNNQPTAFTPGGKELLYEPNTASDIGMVRVGGSPPSAGMPLVASPAREGGGTVSPDGRWLAFQSDESGGGQMEVYVRPFPDVTTPGRWQISTGGGSRPRWSQDGRELFFYVQQGATISLMAVPVTLGASFAAGAAKELFRGNYRVPAVNGPQVYDVSRDGKRFLMIKPAESQGRQASTRIVVVQHWFEELKRLVPTK